MSAASDRLRRVVDALPLTPGLRVIEVGGAPGAAARLVAERVGPAGHVLVLDRSPRGVELTRRGCAEEVAAGVLSVLCVAVEDFVLPTGTEPFDLAFACRVGVLDGRHSDRHGAALDRLRQATVPGAQLFLDTGSPVDVVALHPSGPAGS